MKSVGAGLQYWNLGATRGYVAFILGCIECPGSALVTHMARLAEGVDHLETPDNQNRRT